MVSFSQGELFNTGGSPMRRSRKTILAVVLLALAGIATVLQARGQKSEESSATRKDQIPTLTVCEALSKALEYDGKMIQIRDRVVGTDEGTAFLGEACPGILVTDGKVWPSAIAWTMPDNLDLIIHPVNFSFDWASRKRLQKKWEQIRGQVPAECLAESYTGMFEVWSKAKARKAYRDGWIEIPGFGHLSAAGAQLVLKSADDVTPIPGCKPAQ